MLRWPTAFFLLSIILIFQMSILHKQPVSLPIGGELNGLVPHCKLLTRENYSTYTTVDFGPLTCEKSRKSRRSFAQTSATPPIIRP